MTRVLKATILLAVGAAALALSGSSETAPLRAATGVKQLRDTDGDMLPDSCEWLLQTDPGNKDSDLDDVDDFVEALFYTTHRTNQRDDDAPEAAHRLRLLATAIPDAKGKNAGLWMHLLLSYAGTNTHKVDLHDIFVEKQGVRVSLVSSVGSGGVQVVRKTHKTYGTLFRVSWFMAPESSLRPLLPCAIGVSASFDKQKKTSGLVLTDVDGLTAALLPSAANEFMLHPINTAFQLSNPDPLFKKGRVCQMRLALLGKNKFGRICEVVEADCKAASGLRCSTNCTKQEGSIVLLPAGMDAEIGG